MSQACVRPSRLGVAVFLTLCLCGTAPAGFSEDALDYARLIPLTEGIVAPTAMAVSDWAKVYIAEASLDRVLVYLDGEPVDSLYGLASPICLAVDGLGRLIVGNAGRGNVEVYHPDLTLAFRLGGGDGVTQGARIQVFSAAGVFKRSFGGFGRGEARLIKPLGVAVGDDERVYVSDAYQNVVQVYDSAGALSCGNASCHETDYIHRMKNTGGGGSTALQITATGFEGSFVPPDFTPEIATVEGHIGTNWNNGAQLFKGLIDWVKWEPIADYTGLDDVPN